MLVEKGEEEAMCKQEQTKSWHSFEIISIITISIPYPNATDSINFQPKENN